MLSACFCLATEFILRYEMDAQPAKVPEARQMDSPVRKRGVGMTPRSCTALPQAEWSAATEENAFF